MSQTTFSCRCCGACTEGFYDGSTETDKGWRFVDNIDGPNHVCAECVAEGDSVLDSLREDGYNNVCFGKLCNSTKKGG